MTARPWERRLKDLALILENCFTHYFNPELFRLNLNQFLQTSRTITFIIQKNKSEILNYEEWYSGNIQEPLKNSKLMRWAKDSRNKIEKQGDLEMFSYANAKLIFSYNEMDDKNFASCNEMLKIGVKRLVRRARKELPTGLLDAASIKIERRWVADDLPEWELLQALITIYARLYEMCAQLAEHLSMSIDEEIPSPLSFEVVKDSERKVMYVKLNDMKDFILEYRQVNLLHDFEMPESIRMLLSSKTFNPSSIEKAVEYYSEIASIVFKETGKHYGMVHFLDENFEPISSSVFEPFDQAEKLIFWRMCADRLCAINAKAIVFTSEAWHRELNRQKLLRTPIKKLKIVGESLSTYGIDANLNFYNITQDIERADDNLTGKLLEPKVMDVKLSQVGFFVPIINAFKID